jgi:hypothetical protein
MSRTRKVILVVAGALVLACGAAVGVVLAATSELVAAADGFFLGLKAEGPSGARAVLSRDFLASTGEDALAAYVAQSRLAAFRRASWTSRMLALGGGRGELAGTIELEDGSSLPVQLILVEEDGAWRIDSLARPSLDVSELRASDRLPEPKEQLALVRTNVHELGVARNTGDFTKFWESLARLWQSSTTLEAVVEVFGGSGLHGDFTGLDGQTPAIVGEPRLNEGVLVIQVRYDLEPEPLFVRGTYVNERNAWRLIGLYIGPTQKDG